LTKQGSVIEYIRKPDKMKFRITVASLPNNTACTAPNLTDKVVPSVIEHVVHPDKTHGCFALLSFVRGFFCGSKLFARVVQATASEEATRKQIP